jgi:hypothetical protein
MLAAGNMPYERINQFGSLLGQFPNSANSQQIGAYQHGNTANKVGGAMMTLGNFGSQGGNPSGGGWGSIRPFDEANAITGGRPWAWS